MNKKCLFTYILLFSFLGANYCQVENLDRLNGFKVFKFGDPSSKHSSYIERDKFMPLPSNKVSVYSCNDKEYLSFGILFKGMELSFYENKLYQIMLWSSWKTDEYYAYSDIAKKTYFDIILDEAENIFGQMMRYTTDETSLIAKTGTGIWETDNTRLDIVYMRFSSVSISIQVKFIDKNLESQVNLSKYQ